MTSRIAFTLTLGAAVALLAGCESLQRVPKVDVLTAQPPVYVAAAPQPMPAPAANGAIFQADRYRPLVEDYRARLVGDTLTVQITEKVSATQKATSTIDKSGETDFGITAFPGVKNASKLARLNAAGSNANKFDGKGVTESSNDFSGTITATVVQVLPNGHLIIAGEKQIGVNANVDVLRFSGQVDPRAIVTGNSVASTQIANVRIEQRGRGATSDAHAVGWLSRFFLNIAPS